MAFLISSPLSSPSDVMYETAFFGGKFAIGVLISSIAMGLLAGITAHILEKKTKYFDNQFRFAEKKESSCSCGSEINKKEAFCCEKAVYNAEEKECGSGCSNKDKINKADIKGNQIIAKTECACSSEKNKESGITNFIKKYKLDKFLLGIYDIGVKKVLLYFVIFIAIGKVTEMLIPKEWIYTLFSSNKAYSIPLAATIGLPLYLNDSSALPLIKSFVNSGAGEGAALAFIIAGKATGVPVIAGMATFIKRRAMFFYVGFVYAGAIIAGYLYQIIVH
jgi:uncharacterized membrane protein YraQ (UPF0718 family)